MNEFSALSEAAEYSYTKKGIRLYVEKHGILVCRRWLGDKGISEVTKLVSWEDILLGNDAPLVAAIDRLLEHR